MIDSVRKSLNDANPNILPVAAQQADLGDQLYVAPKVLQGAVSANTFNLPFSCIGISYCFAIAGTVTGPMTPVAEDLTLATKQCKLGPAGRTVSFFATDAVTSVVLCVIPAEGQELILELPVVTNTLLLPGGQSALRLLSATAVTGTAPGLKAVVARGAAPAAGQAALNLTGTGVVFNGTDAITSARVTVLLVGGIGSAEPGLAARLTNSMTGY